MIFLNKKINKRTPKKYFVDETATFSFILIIKPRKRSPKKLQKERKTKQLLLDNNIGKWRGV